VKHRLHATPATVHWGHLQADLEPRLQVRSGDHVEIETFSGGRADLGGDLSIVAPAHREIIETVMPMDGPHILTGPIAVEGSKPGDCLEVRIESIRLGADWGYNLIRPGRGTLPDEFHQPRQNTFPIDRDRSVTHLLWGNRCTPAPVLRCAGHGTTSGVGEGVVGSASRIRRQHR